MNIRKLLACLMLFGGILIFVGPLHADNCDYAWERAKSAGDSYKRLKPDNSSSNDRNKAANAAYEAWKGASNACSGVNATQASDNAAIYLEGVYYEACRSTILNADERLDKAIKSLNASAGDDKSAYTAAIQLESESNGWMADADKALSWSTNHAGKTYRCKDSQQRALNLLKETAQKMRAEAQCLAGSTVAGAKGADLLKRIENTKEWGKQGVWESIDAELGAIINRQDTALSTCSGDMLAPVKEKRGAMSNVRTAIACEAWSDRSIELFTATMEKKYGDDFAREESAWQPVVDASDQALSYCKPILSDDKKEIRLGLINVSRSVAVHRRDTANQQKKAKLCTSYLAAARSARRDAGNHAGGSRFAEAVQSEQLAMNQYASAQSVCTGDQLQQVVRETAEAKQGAQGGVCNRDFSAARQESELWRKVLLSGGAEGKEMGQQLKVEAAWGKAHASCTGEKQQQVAAILVAVRSRPVWSKDPVTGMEFVFVFVEGGCYQMGDNFGDGYGNEKPVHNVCVNDFYMGKYEVTQGQWQAVMGSNPSRFEDCGSNCPVEQVSWDDAQEFVRKLNGKSDKTYRLPTEAEWEYAARSGGKKEKYAGGDDLDRVAWYNSNSGSRTHAVGTKAPNGLGIYDMSGNVWEWVQDWNGAYPSSSVTDPAGPASGSARVNRGGSWGSGAGYCRSANRGDDDPGLRGSYLGFRLLRTR